MEKSNNFSFNTEAPFTKGIRLLFSKLESHLNLDRACPIYLLGDAATNLYADSLSSGAIQIELGARVHIPQDLTAQVALANGTSLLFYFDPNHNSNFSLTHPDYRERSIHVDLGLERIQLCALHPTDLALSRITQLDGGDRAAIRMLVERRYTSAVAIEQSANEALMAFVGNVNMLKTKIRDAVRIAKEVEAKIAGESTPAVAPSAPKDPA
jgi:hypothetical protein